MKRHQGTNKCQRQPITIELMNIISQYLNFSDYNHTILCPAAALGFLVSYALVSSPTTPTSIPTSKLLSAMSTLTLSTLWWIPFAKVAISTLVLRNVISAPCAPLQSIYMCVAQLLAHISFSLRHPSKLTMADIWYSIQSSPLLGSLVATSVITTALKSPKSCINLNLTSSGKQLNLYSLCKS